MLYFMTHKIQPTSPQIVIHYVSVITIIQIDQVYFKIQFVL